MPVPSGTCRWTLSNGVWTVESNCGSGQVCVEMTANSTTMANPTTNPANTARIAVPVNTAGQTFPTGFGVPDADFRSMLAARHALGHAITVTSASGVSAFAGAMPASPTTVDVPCQPAPATNLATALSLRKA